MTSLAFIASELCSELHQLLLLSAATCQHILTRHIVILIHILPATILTPSKESTEFVGRCVGCPVNHGISADIACRHSRLWNDLEGELVGVPPRSRDLPSRRFFDAPSGPVM